VAVSVDEDTVLFWTGVKVAEFEVVETTLPVEETVSDAVDIVLLLNWLEAAVDETLLLVVGIEEDSVAVDEA
jgi:hypothetical protein